MKRVLLAILMVFACVSLVNAGEVATWQYGGDSGTTLVNCTTNTTGVSTLVTFDMSKMSDLQRNCSIQLPPLVYYGDTTASSVGTGVAATSGTTLTYYCYVNNRELTDSELETLTTASSGVSQIFQGSLSGSSKFLVDSFTPTLGKYLTIFGKSGITNIREPGFILTVQ